MFTINTGMMPVLGKNMKAVSAAFNNNSNMHFKGMDNTLQNDVFVKSNTSFTGTSLVRQLSTDYDSREMAQLEEEIEKNYNRVWEVAARNNGIYFRRVNMKKPEFRFVEEERPKEGWNLTTGKRAEYDWVNNVITINKSYVPNMALISDGKVALVPQRMAADFAIKSGIIPEFFLDANDKTITDAIEESKKGNHYYIRLKPKDTAELLGAPLANEVSHMMTTHLVYNTFEMGTKTMKPVFEKLQKEGMLPKYGARDWKKSYPENYKMKTPGHSPYDGEDVMKIKGDGFSTFVKHKHIPGFLFGSDVKNLENPVELKAKIDALTYCRAHKIATDRSIEDQDKMRILLNIQKEHYQTEVEQRARALHLR